MTIYVTCVCGRRLKTSDNYAGRRGECLTCGRIFEIPAASSAGAAATPPPVQKPAESDALDIVDFLDPPGAPKPAPTPKQPAKPVMTRMLEALLDPQAIQWMLMIGGGLAVLGLIIWLVSLRVFDDPRIMATALGLTSLAVLGGGWWVTLKTRYRVAGRALTFLGCVVLPLNLWFLHAQNLVTLDQHLWIGGLVCVALYAATVYVLRDGLFMYAVEVGVTLTVLLLMADLGMIADSANLAMFLLGLAFASIHAERAFPPEGEFERKKYGLPLFWCGHAQLAVALAVLLGSQILGWLVEPLELTWQGSLLTQNTLLAGTLWFVAMYLYLYSDLVVRRVGVYISLSALSLLMALVTLVLPQFNQEGLIVVLATTSLAAQILRGYALRENEKFARYGTTVSVVMSEIPVLMGIVLHLRATSSFASTLGWSYSTGWLFVGAMVFVAACNRVSAYLCRNTQPKLSAAFFFFSAASVLVAAAGLLRQMGWTEWSQQSVLLMLVPIGYLIAARLWRGHSPETPLARVAHASAAVILLGTLIAALEHDPISIVRPMTGKTANLLVGLTFVEATLFYVLAGMFRRRSWNASFATIAACGALWQFLGYFGVPASSHTLIFAGLGLAALFAARVLGLEHVVRYNRSGEKQLSLRGPGLTAFLCGNGILSVALVAAFLKGLAELAGHGIEWFDLTMLFSITGAGFAGMAIVPAGGWRRWYTVAAIALAGVTFLTLNVLIDLSGWQKLEIFCVAVGLVLLAAGHVGRFREAQRKQDDTVSVSLWLGSILAAVPLFIAMIYHRFVADHPSLTDELALLTVTIVMVVSGCGWRIKSTTLLGGAHLALYLIILIIAVAYRPEVAIGFYLLAGGAVVFGLGVLLSIYRDRLLALPEQIAKRQGLFRVIDWR